MHDYVIPSIDTPSLTIADDHRRFPIRRVFCIGRNYPWPGADTTKQLPSYFMKPADAVVPAVGIVPYPPLTDEFCHEIELIVALGKDAEAISPEQALQHVWGYAVGVDLTRRDHQTIAKKTGQSWESAKAFDASATTTPLIPVDRIASIRSAAIWLAVNGVERQRASLADQLWQVDDIISFLSHSVALKAGDIIYTGTPFGVATLAPGDVVSGGVEGLNTFSFTVGSRPDR